MSVRTHHRRNFKKRTNVRNRTKRNTKRKTKHITKRNTKHNTKRRINRRVKRTKRYARMRGGDDTGFLSKSEHYKDGSGPLAAAHDGKATGVLTRPVGWSVGKIAGDEAAKKAVNTVRVAREGTKTLGRVAKTVGEGVLYAAAAADSVMH
jgi:hypothetical protein